NEPCRTCHSLMNPIGFSFDHFDDTGRWRDDDGGFPIDTSGHLIATDVDGTFADQVELVRMLDSSEQVRSCVVLHWFRYAYGRDRTEDDACTSSMLDDVFVESGG